MEEIQMDFPTASGFSSYSCGSGKLFCREVKGTIGLTSTNRQGPGMFRWRLASNLHHCRFHILRKSLPHLPSIFGCVLRPLRSMCKMSFSLTCADRGIKILVRLFSSTENWESNWPSETSMRLFLAEKTQCILLHMGSGDP
jgi:hypothetical protein